MIRLYVYYDLEPENDEIVKQDYLNYKHDYTYSESSSVIMIVINCLDII